MFEKCKNNLLTELAAFKIICESKSVSFFRAFGASGVALYHDLIFTDAHKYGRNVGKNRPNVYSFLITKWTGVVSMRNSIVWIGKIENPNGLSQALGPGNVIISFEMLPDKWNYQSSAGEYIIIWKAYSQKLNPLKLM